MGIEIGMYGCLQLFKPQPDVTPLEAVRLTEFLVLAANGAMRFGPKNQQEAFIDLHGLKRHWEPVP